MWCGVQRHYLASGIGSQTASSVTGFFGGVGDSKAGRESFPSGSISYRPTRGYRRGARGVHRDNDSWLKVGAPPVLDRLEMSSCPSGWSTEESGPEHRAGAAAWARCNLHRVGAAGLMVLLVLLAALVGHAFFLLALSSGQPSGKER
ncbi:hypothetical protein CPLU01_04524 [Colletotrichum plurivorum]|uniref:Uncharacterized protein n=1 Tax=Colletotrichum plurivorum TaxID=2175906 RepID=A0A8H6KQF9_9PEZI|nr:hypothetical protein CPLU01_04524 [Colletotrichum plurivorum]